MIHSDSIRWNLEQEKMQVVNAMVKMVLVNCFQSALGKKCRCCSFEVLKISYIFCYWLLCIQASQEQRNDREMDGLGLTK